MSKLPTTAGVVSLLVGAMIGAQAAAYAAPMTTANEPPVITNPGVKAGLAVESFNDGFEILLKDSLVCPTHKGVAVSVSFTDVNGESTERLTRPCNAEWANTATITPNPLTEWSVNSTDGISGLEEAFLVAPSVQFEPPPGAQGQHPFLYQVSDAAGILAQAPITAESTPEQTITEGSGAFQEDCASTGNVRRTSAGVGYCVIHAQTRYFTGWPPTPAPVEAPIAAKKAPPNQPGLYSTPHSRTRKVAVRVSKDGERVSGISIKINIECEHGYTYEEEGSWLSPHEAIPIVNHVAKVTLETAATPYVRSGSIGVFLQFNGSGGVVGRLRVRIRAKSKQVGLCYARTIKFTAKT